MGLTWQPSLLGDMPTDPTLSDPAMPDRWSTRTRRDLGRGAWVDRVPTWYAPASELFEHLLQHAPWRSEDQRVMYDRLVDVPRLTTGDWTNGRPSTLDDLAHEIGSFYDSELVSVSANLYRSGRDSVAWHGDRVGRTRAVTIVAILSLGSPRTLLLRPNGGGGSISYTMHSGDLLVMGGTTQVTHEHCVPKRSHAGPRISVMFREQFGN